MNEYIKVIWLDNEIENFKIDMGHLALNGIVCYPAHTLTEMHTVLLEVGDIDVLVIDKNLGADEDGEQMLENFRIAFPDIGALIYSNYVTTEPASNANPIGKLAKTASVTRRLNENALVNGIRIAFEHRPSNINRTREYSLWAHAMSATWEFLHAALVLTLKPLGLLGISMVAILQSVPSLATIDQASALTFINTLKSIIPLILSIGACWIFYLWRCPERMRGCSSLHSYETKWRRQYVVNPRAAEDIRSQLGDEVFASQNVHEAAQVNVNMLFYIEAFAKPASRFVLAAGLITSILFYGYAVVTGLIDARGHL